MCSVVDFSECKKLLYFPEKYNFRLINYFIQFLKDMTCYPKHSLKNKAPNTYVEDKGKSAFLCGL